MAFLISKDENTVKVICSRDSALADDTTDEELEAYFSDLDESRLRLKEGQKPTYFVLNYVLDYETDKKMMSKQMKMEILPGHKRPVSVPDPSYMIDKIRCSLVDIIHPDYLTPEQLAGTMVFEKSKDDNYASKNLISLMHANGIVMELFVALSMITQRKKTDEDLTKKK